MSLGKRAASVLSPDAMNVAGRRVARLVRAHWRQGLVALHIAKVLYWIRAVNPLSGMPLVNVDYIQFYGRTIRMDEFFSRSGRLWGYDPFDMAGYISGPFHEVGTHLMAMIAILFKAVLPISVSMLIVQIAGLALAPLLVFPTMRLMGAGRRAAWTAFGILVFTFGVVEPFSTSMYKLGLWGFMMCGFLSLTQVALLNRWMEGGAWRHWAAFTLCSAVLFQVHPAALVIVMAPNAALYAFSARRLGWARHAALAATAVLVVAANWYWISPFLAFSHWRITAPYYITDGIAGVFARFGPLQQDLYSSVRALISLGSVALGGIAVRRIWRTRPVVARVIVIWAAWLFVISYFGSFIPWVRTLQPGRNEFPLFLLLYALSAAVFHEEVLARRRPRVVAGALVPFLMLFMFERGPGISPWSQYAQPLRTELPSWQENFIQRLRTLEVSEGRVMLECADDLNPHFADIVPHLTGAILLGGQHPGNFLTTRFSLFTGDWVSGVDVRSKEPMGFGKELETMPEATFAAYLDLYNVVAVVARTPQMIAVLDRMVGTLKLEVEEPPHRIYRVRRKPGWLAKGSGRVSFDYDTIKIEGASKGDLVVRAHWFDTFKATPPVPIRPVLLMDDPVPFLHIDNAAGHKTIVVENAGLPGLLDRLSGKRTGAAP